MPLLQSSARELLDLGLGANVDAARRLIQDQRLRIAGQPARQQHLLLVSAAEMSDRLLGVWRRDIQRPNVLVGDFFLRLRGQLRTSRACPAAPGSCSRGRKAPG